MKEHASPSVVPPAAIPDAQPRLDAPLRLDALPIPAEQPIPPAHHVRTPREVAKAMLRPSVQRGEALDLIAASRFGHYGQDYVAQIAGAAVREDDHDRVVKLGPRDLAVLRVGATPRIVRFALAEFWR